MRKLLKKIGKAATSTWRFFDGKKTTIGTVVYLAGEGLKAFELMPTNQATFIIKVGMAIAGGGLLFKAGKTETAKNVTNKAIEKVSNFINTKN